MVDSIIVLRCAFHWSTDRPRRKVQIRPK